MAAPSGTTTAAGANDPLQHSTGNPTNQHSQRGRRTRFPRRGAARYARRNLSELENRSKLAELVDQLRAERARLQAELGAAKQDTENQHDRLVELVRSVDISLAAVEEVEQQRALLDAIIEGTPIGLALFDRGLRIVNVNSTWVEMVGLDGTPADLMGRCLYELVSTARSRESLHRRALAGESIRHIDVEYRHPVSGRAVYCDVYYSPLREAGGAVRGMLVALVDVAVRHEADRQKDDFIALAAHELKSPITSIKGLSQMLVRRSQQAESGQELDEHTVRSLNVIDEQTSRLSALIDEMLDVSRVGGDRLELHIAPTDLGDLIREVVANAELAAPDFPFSVDMPNPGEAPVIVNADRQRIEQVLSNLLQNAVKYSGEHKCVNVSLKALRPGHENQVLDAGDPGEQNTQDLTPDTQQPGEALVAVRDYGIGIPAGEMQRVFERFFRGSNTQYRAGLGLGLFISHGIIEAHGGKMWCESAEGKGSTFYVSLPLVGSGPGGS